MRSGSSGRDGRGWQPAQHPYHGQSGPMPDAPYGPEVSWPNGFRRMEFDTGEYRRLVDDHYQAARRPGNRHQQPAAEDFGYGDPGYADPRYDGPRDRYPTGPLPAVQPDHIYPVTGAQEVLRDDHHPRYRRPAPHPTAPPVSHNFGGPRYDEPLSDEAWYAELRRDPGPQAAPPPAPPPAAPPVRNGYRGPQPRYQAPPQPYLPAPVAQTGVLTPQRPRVDTVETLEAYWQEDQSTALLREVAIPETRTAQVPVRRPAGRRRGRSSDHRLWLGLLGVIIVAGGAIFIILKFFMPHPSGPAHTLVMPQRIGAFAYDGKMAKSGDLDGLIKGFAKETDVHAAAYSAGKSTGGLPTKSFLVIEGHLANQSPSASMAAFLRQYPRAEMVEPGVLGGEAACVETNSASGSAAECVWFDNDTVGEMTSPTMSPRELALYAMPVFRPAIETIPPK